jgi:NAD(P)-dependent dehydrogenase (short-subunit alcohol dehydrogenase family)
MTAGHGVADAAHYAAREGTAQGCTIAGMKLAARRPRRPADSMGGYGLPKACLTAYTMLLEKEHPNLRINCCSPCY